MFKRNKEMKSKKIVILDPNFAGERHKLEAAGYVVVIAPPTAVTLYLAS